MNNTANKIIIFVQKVGENSNVVSAFRLSVLRKLKHTATVMGPLLHAFALDVI
jgi:hypothetical protein